MSDKCRLAIVLLAIPVAVYFAFDRREGGGKYGPLYTGLSDADSSAVRVLLEKWHVPFELRDGGQAILVPAERVTELKVELDRAHQLGLWGGLPTGGRASEDTVGWGLSVVAIPGLEPESSSFEHGVAAFGADSVLGGK